MAYYSDSSSSEEEAALNDVVSSEHIIQPLVDAESTSEEDSLPDQDSSTMVARAYQLEMFEASLKENIIVAMDTGSGKTQVAVLRIRAELERSPVEKIVWFLAPTVSLCAQQLDVINSQIPAVQSKMLSGADGIDTWSDEKTWDGVLLNVRVVVSTYQVLYDAMSHAFVRMESLSLIVFDEAHNCTKKHPGSKLMKEFYWRSKAQQRPVPHILGLTASPVVKSNIKGLEELEVILDAICKSPTKHREELLQHSQRPSMFNVLYRPRPDLSPNDFTKSMANLHKAREQLNILEDPYVLSLKAENSERSRRKLGEVLMSHKTYIQKQMKDFCRRSVEICKDLGRWAADWYIHETIARFLAGVGRQGATDNSYRDAEVVLLVRIFQNIDAVAPAPLTKNSDVSEKVMKLIEVLLGHEGEAKGIVFAKERATIAVLSQILTSKSEIKQKYRIATMVGTSFVPGIKRDFLDLALKEDSSLEAFRSGKVNLIVATSVLEEGIDVPNCNLVVCVDEPKNLKSFIQRRGRARMQSSRLYILLEHDAVASARKWEQLEAEMKERYEDEMREHQRMEELEDSEVPDYPELYVPSTGAHLTIDNAKAHLQHFTATLSSRQFVDLTPDYLVEKVASGSVLPGAPTMIRVTVILPVSVPLEIRRVNSSRAWMSEKNACKDAAFQAYKALYEAKLVNDNLLPLKNVDRSLEDRPGLTQAREQLNPWISIARDWRDNKELHRCPFRLLDQRGSMLFQADLIFPRAIPKTEPLALFWDHNTQLTLFLDADVKMTDPEDELNQKTSNDVDHIPLLLTMAYGHRWDVRDQQCVIRIVSESSTLSLTQIGSHPFETDRAADGRYLVRDTENVPYFYQSFLSSKPPIKSIQKTYKGYEDSPEHQPFVVVKNWPKKTGFFHPFPPTHGQPTSTKPYPRILPAIDTRVDGIPLVYAQCGMLIPSIIRYLEVYLIATELLETVLKELNLSHCVSQIVTAICASSAREPTDYERIEFLGDSILKLCTTINCAALQLHWPESLLSLLKDKLVNNNTLSKAAKWSKLDQFVITQQLTSKKWRPPYVSDLLEETHQAERKRTMATKTLADVVESIIGVCYLNGGLAKAVQCITIFLPEGRFQDLETARMKLYQAALSGLELLTIFQPLEELIGYTFNKKSLLVEAMTHPSCNMLGSTTACYERLEFLGDAVLDFVILREVFAVDPPLENFEMHLLRTALVNGDILGFLVMEWSYRQQRFDVKDADDKTLVKSEVTFPLWTFMRHSSAALADEQKQTAKRHEILREPIIEAIRHGTHYPWALLARLRARKFYSDLFEAIVGAIWVDSGDYDKCKDFVERAGILPLLRRILGDKVHILHPKEELGRLADSETVQYMVDTVQTEDGGNTFNCKVLVGKRLVARVDGALWKEEAKTLGAEAAVRLMKEGARP